MPYYPDKTVCGSIIRVGWLDKAVPFDQGPVDGVFLEKLLGFYRDRRNQTRGYHHCPLCSNPEFGLPIEIDGQRIKLGSAEIHVVDSGGRVFVAPDLLYHYVTVHGYRPCDGFVEAVMATA